MKPNNIEDIYPLAPMQQGILFHTLVADAPETYLIQIAWTLRGPLDPAAFRRAFQEIVDRHPALRTAFAWEKLAEPVQIVWRRLKLPCEEHDLRGLAPAEQAERVRRFAEDDRRRGFDPTRAPLLRIALLRLADDVVRFVWTMHHLLLDGWSTQIVVKEVFLLHDAYRRGQEPALPRARPYAEFVGWLQKQDGARADAFWRDELAGFTSPTALPASALPAATPSAVGEARFGEHALALPEAEGAALAAFARAHGITLSTLVQGAWAVLLARYGGRDDVVFGSTVSGRSAPVAGIEGMVGLFINTLPVRARVAPGEPAIAWLLRFQQHEAALREHEHSPLARVQALSGVPRGTPLFESLVVFENFPIAEAGAGQHGAADGRLAVTASEGREQPPYPLTLSAFFSRSLRLQIGYDARRFDAPTIARLTGHLTTLLQGIAAAPETPDRRPAHAHGHRDRAARRVERDGRRSPRRGAPPRAGAGAGDPHAGRRRRLGRRPHARLRDARRRRANRVARPPRAPSASARACSSPSPWTDRWSCARSPSSACSGPAAPTSPSTRRTRPIASPS